jgi:hypothetical protein
MAEAKTARSATKGLKVKAMGETMRVASRKTQWIVSAGAAKTVDELTFTSRDAEGRIRWWDVNPPRTDYWPAHRMLGRAYAFEVLDLINNPDATDTPRHQLRCILGAIADWLPTVHGTSASGMADGFHSVISEYVATGTADR